MYKLPAETNEIYFIKTFKQIFGGFKSFSWGYLFFTSSDVCPGFQNQGGVKNIVFPIFPILSLTIHCDYQRPNIGRSQVSGSNKRSTKTTETLPGHTIFRS